MLHWRARSESDRGTNAPSDVCLVVEGCYPYVPGGVSSWIDWLMRSLPEVNFSLVAIVAGSEGREPRYRFPPNLTSFHEIDLHEPLPSRLFESAESRRPRPELADALISMTLGGGLKEFERVNEIINRPGSRLSIRDLLSSRLAWDVVCRLYEGIMPQASFLHFYWAWRSLFGGLYKTLSAPLPPARVYHTISTGYAGLVAARAAIETGRPAIVTEHGIYTNERRIEILMAEWITDTIDKGISLDDDRIDLRDVWMKAFEAYARACYAACSVIITLYQDNQRMQLAHGAESQKLKVIANGIDLGRFTKLPRAGKELPPTIALIGRVVPIKDVKTYIAAVAEIRKQIPNLRALVLGPTTEDPAYFEECAEFCRELDLEGTLIFTGNVNLVEYMPTIHVVVLTSLSEAQPLVLLEAGAAGIPCVTTNVGSCREILEGRSDERPNFGRGGYVTDLVSPNQIAEAVVRLLLDERLRRDLGEALCRRVCRDYGSDRARREYEQLYHNLIAAHAVRQPKQVA
jgi:polysaccharide biosynthesis protein PelF